MNILIVSPLFPLPLTSGGHTRLYNLMKHLGRRHTLDLVAPIPAQDESCAGKMADICRRVATVTIGGKAGRTNGSAAYGGWGRSMRRVGQLLTGVPLEVSGFHFPELQAQLDELLREHVYDIVQVEFPRMTQYFSRRFFAEYPAQKIVVDYDLTFVPHWQRYQCATGAASRAVRYADYLLNRRYALRSWRRYDALVVMSEQDRKKVSALLPELAIRVVPNGVDLDLFAPIERRQTQRRVIFLGGTGHYANVDGLSYFMQDVYLRLKERLADLELVVVGQGWPDADLPWLNKPGVRFTGFVENMREEFAGSAAMVVPLRIGGGTRLKILEAMALKVPVVSTTVGCEGIEALDEQHVLIGDTPDAFAGQVQRLFCEDGLGERLRENAYQLVRTNYGWESLAHKMEAVYEEHAGGP